VQALLQNEKYTIGSRERHHIIDHQL